MAGYIDVGISGSGGSAGPSSANSAVTFGDTTVGGSSKWQQLALVAGALIVLLGLYLYWKR